MRENERNVLTQLNVSKYLCPDFEEAVFMRRKRICIFVLNVKQSAALKLLEQYGFPNTSVTLNNFSSSPFGLN